MILSLLAHQDLTTLGAFTPGCSARHLPSYIDNLSKLKSKGVDIVAVIAFNDAWVMSAWGKANGMKGDDIVSSLRNPGNHILRGVRNRLGIDSSSWQ